MLENVTKTMSLGHFHDWQFISIEGKVISCDSCLKGCFSTAVSKHSFSKLLTHFDNSLLQDRLVNQLITRDQVKWMFIDCICQNDKHNYRVKTSNNNINYKKSFYIWNVYCLLEWEVNIPKNEIHNCFSARKCAMSFKSKIS